MSWEEGYKPKCPRENWTKKFEELKGDLDEDEAIYYFCKFLRENPTFAADMIMGVTLYPFQAMMVKAMEECDYTLGVMGRGLSKSFTTSIFASLYAIYNPGVQIGILSKTFRQSKMIIQKILDIAKKPEAAVLNQAITNFSKSTDQWELEFGQSKIIALPLGDGEKLRGFRFQVIVIDEFLLMPESVVNEVIIPFLGVVPNPTERRDLRIAEDALIKLGKMLPEDRHVWPNNKLVALSSASYTFEHLYKTYKQYEEKILVDPEKQEDGSEKVGFKKLNGSYCIFHLSAETAPEDLYDANLIEKAKSEMSEAQFAREFLAQFTDDSSGYFKISKMEACTVPDGSSPMCEMFGEKDEEYILSFDPSWADTDTSDDWALQILKIVKGEKKAVLVHSYARAGAQLGDHIKYVKYAMTHFNIVLMIGDYNGGLMFVNACNESNVFKDAGLSIGVIECDLTNQEGIDQFKREYQPAQRKYCILQKPTSEWIRIGNESLQAAFDHRSLWFGSRATNEFYKAQISADFGIGDIQFAGHDNKSASARERKIDFIENLADEIERTKIECATIVVSSSPTGVQSFDMPVNLKKQTGPNRPRKDSYSALVLANWAFVSLLKSRESKATEVNSTFTPFFA